MQTPGAFLVHELSHNAAVRQRIVVLPLESHSSLITRRGNELVSVSGSGSSGNSGSVARLDALAMLTMHAQRAPCVEIASVPIAIREQVFQRINTSVFVPRLSRDDADLLNLFSAHALAFLHRHQILVGLQAGTLMGIVI